MKSHKFSALILIILITLFLISCTSKKIELIPLVERGPRISSLGFSFIPPPGESWMENFNDNSIEYVKRTDPAKRTFFTGVTELSFKQSFANPDDFLKFIEKKRQLNNYPGRYKNSKSEYNLAPDIAPICVRYHERLDDHGAKNLYGRDFLLVENVGVMCLHPENPKVGVDIFYSERYENSEKNDNFRDDGQGFIDSLKFLPVISNAEVLPSFFEFINEELFFPEGMDEWKSQKNIKGENFSLLQWKNSSEHEITLKYRNATPNTIQSVFQVMGEEIDKSIKEVGGNIVTINEFFAVVLINDTQWNHSVNLLYGTPEGAYLWKYKVPNTLETNYDNYIATITSVAREHQYDVALKYGNVVMGRWGAPVHEFAKLLASQNDSRTQTVYKNLLQTSPSNYDAQIEYTSVTKNPEEASQSAKIIERDAEEESLLKASAKILNKDISSFSSYPLLGTKDKGLKVILIPLEPCNPWLLSEIAKTYEKITTIPVVVRRLPVTWTVPEPSRSAYRPYLEKIASNIWKTESDFSDWPLSKLKEEIMKKAKDDGPQAVTSINQIFKKMEEAGYQWNADPIMGWLSQAIAPYFSNDPNTMVVGITELDIYSGETNFVFSIYGGRNTSPVSILSYAKMRAKMTKENQSRKRLTERAAKELIPASLKKLNIPRSMDPSCPYSYSGGLQRLEEKSLNLSEPVKKEIERIKKHGMKKRQMTTPSSKNKRERYLSISAQVEYLSKILPDYLNVKKEKIFIKADDIGRSTVTITGDINDIPEETIEEKITSLRLKYKTLRPITIVFENDASTSAQ